MALNSTKIQMGAVRKVLLAPLALILTGSTQTSLKVSDARGFEVGDGVTYYPKLQTGGATMTGTIDAVDLVTNTITLDETGFSASPTAGGFIFLTTPTATVECTESPLEWNYTQDLTRMRHEQALAAVDGVATEEALQVSFTAYEMDLPTWNALMQRTALTSRAHANGPPIVKAAQVITGGGLQFESCLGAQILCKHRHSGLDMAFWVWRCKSINGMQISLGKAEAARLPVVLEAYADTNRPDGEQLFGWELLQE